MGCSASTLDQQLLSISATTAATSSSKPTTNPRESAASCCRTAPVHQPPPTDIGCLIFVDLNSARPDSMIDTWNIVDDDDVEAEDEVEFHLVARVESSLHKLLETYEIVEPLWKQNLPVEDSLLDLNITPKPKPKPKPKPVVAVNKSSDSKAIGLQRKKDDKVVLYITSLRGIRKTYDDCSAVKLILDGFRLAVDVRDIAMDVKCRRELQSLLGLEGKPVAVPQLFIGAKHVGGGDEVRRLNELGELRKLLEGYPVRPALVCCICGDARFLLCIHCSGSAKVFDEEHMLSRKCSHCSENGLVKCPNCNI
ncbi:unnamed protein product [Rhodiola kirilowii]